MQLTCGLLVRTCHVSTNPGDNDFAVARGGGAATAAPESPSGATSLMENDVPPLAARSCLILTVVGPAAGSEVRPRSSQVLPPKRSLAAASASHTSRRHAQHAAEALLPPLPLSLALEAARAATESGSPSCSPAAAVDLAALAGMGTGKVPRPGKVPLPLPLAAAEGLLDDQDELVPLEAEDELPLLEAYLSTLGSGKPRAGSAPNTGEANFTVRTTKPSSVRALKHTALIAGTQTATTRARTSAARTACCSRSL